MHDPTAEVDALRDNPEALNDPDALAPTIAEVDLANLRHNARTLKAYAGSAELMGVVKADAYGHGAPRIAHTLQEEGVRHFAVATLPEAIRLRQAGIEDMILVFAAPLPEYLPHYARYALDVTVPSLDVARDVLDTARTWGPMRVHVKVDTGMGRIGVPPEEVGDVIRLFENKENVQIGGLWTHFAMADEPQDAVTEEQIRRFDAVIEQFPDAAEYVHLANSPATLRYPESHRPYRRALVRTGMALYGYTNLASLTAEAGLRPVMTVRSRVTHLKTVPPGTPLSYGHTWRSPDWRRIATVSAGYADGYPRNASNEAEVAIRGRRYRQVGNVCMDMVMVDLGNPDGPGAAVQAGDDAILFGEAGPTAFELAQWARTIPYEITCRVAPRVPRRYHNGELRG
ncbi:MAG TPA: alanine racemase [Rhodothermales bacterium]|nr:alanine racemase [Rhodothermales bacterium]